MCILDAARRRIPREERHRTLLPEAALRGRSVPQKALEGAGLLYNTPNCGNAIRVGRAPVRSLNASPAPPSRLCSSRRATTAVLHTSVGPMCPKSVVSRPCTARRLGGICSVLCGGGARARAGTRVARRAGGAMGQGTLLAHSLAGRALFVGPIGRRPSSQEESCSAAHCAWCLVISA